VIPDGDNGADSDNDGHTDDQHGGGGSGDGDQTTRHAHQSPPVQQTDAATHASQRSDREPADLDDSQPNRLSDDVSLT
jgi:hypothetical protein